MPTWTLVYKGFKPEEESLREALTVLGNGYFCTRGAAEWADASDVHYPGTYLAGGFNRLVTQVAGRPVVNEDLVNMPNWLCLTFRIDGGKWFDLADVSIQFYRQILDVKNGEMRRVIRFTDKKGRRTSLVSRRIVNMAKPHLAAIEWTVTAKNWSGKMLIRSALDGRVVNWGVKRYRELNSRHLEPLGTDQVNDDGICALVQTNQSRIQVAEAARTRIYVNGDTADVGRKIVQKKGYIALDLAVDVRKGEPVRVEKMVAFYTSRDRGIFEPATEARTAITRVGTYDEMKREHVLAWEQLWRRCDIELEKKKRTQLILRVHIFHLLQTVSRNTIDLDAGVPARGLHGEAYRGHIFWDELYIFPFLNFRTPEITHSLLLYRHRRLDEARALAREAGYKGAMFPWQSGSNGREETQVVHLNPKSGRWIADLSHRQRHVNAAIAYNVWQHYMVTGNQGFMSVYGTEMLMEIARFWASIAHFNPARDRYEIHGVMGPDEYHEQCVGSEEPGLKNNAYTNVMVAWIMGVTLQALDELLDYRREELRETLQITDAEVSLWADMAHKMYVPFHKDGIISQFEGYEDLEEFDWKGYRKKYGNIQRLDRILEAEGDTPNRYKLAKQADTLMLFYLFSEEALWDIFGKLGYPFDETTAPRNIAYYEERTSHGSTLSNVVHSAIVARHNRASAWKMFSRALKSDIADIQGGTTPEGIHLGVMAGTVDLVQRGYMGVEIRDGVLFFNPLLPDRLDGLKVHMRYRGMWIDVRLTADKLYLSPRPGGPSMVRVGVRDKVYFLKPGYAREFPL